MKMRKCMAIVGGLCLVAGVAGAEWERTVSAWDTRFAGRGGLQLSLWGGYWESEQAGADSTSVDTTLYVTYGILENWSLSLAPGWTYIDTEGMPSENGLADSRVMSTFRFLDEKDAGLDVAVMGAVRLPTGDEDKGLGSGSAEPELALLASKTCGPVILVANAGGSVITDADEGEEDFTLWAAIEGIVPVSQSVSLNAVLTAETARWEDEDEMVDVGLGARVKPTEQFFIVGVVYACLTDAYDWGAQLACGFEF